VKAKWIAIVVVGIITAGGLIFGYREMSQERAREAEREKPVTAKSQITRGAAGEPTITLEAEAQKHLLLKIETLAPIQFLPELKAYGRVLDPTPLATLAAELAAAQATAEASTLELERLKTLAAQTNASARALQTAEAVARRDRAQAQAARQRLFATWGEAVAGESNLAEFVQSLVLLHRALVQVNLAAGEDLKSPPTNVRLMGLAHDADSVTGRFLGSAPAIDPQTQGQGLLFLVSTNHSWLVPGAAVTCQIQLSGGPLAGVVVPDTALVRFDGKAWAYVQMGENTFTRRRIPLDHPTAEGWFTSAGVAANERVVVGGAQMLLSEERKHQIRLPD